MSARYRMHIAAVIQSSYPHLFEQLLSEYAREHSRQRAYYMSDQLKFWDSGKVDVQPTSLERFATLYFPEISKEEKQSLLEFLYQDYKTNNPDAHYLRFRIDYNLETKIAELKRILEDLNSPDYNLRLSSAFRDGLAWICRGDSEEARTTLYPYVRKVGQANFASASPVAYGFLEKLRKGELAVPFEKVIPLSHGSIRLDYNYRLTKRFTRAFGVFTKKLSPGRLFMRQREAEPDSDAYFVTPEQIESYNRREEAKEELRAKLPEHLDIVRQRVIEITGATPETVDLVIYTSEIEDFRHYRGEYLHVCRYHFKPAV